MSSLWIDPQYFEKLKRLQDPEHADFLGELVDSFAHSMSDGIAQLKDTLEKTELKLLAKTAHRMKSGALSLGAAPLGLALSRLEESAGRADATQVSEQIEGIRRDVAATLVHLKSLLQS